MKTILTMVAITALLASPALAKTVRHHQSAPSAIPNASERGPYTPDAVVPPHGRNTDFQDGSRGWRREHGTHKTPKTAEQ
jgi:hypothetical protein